MCQSRFLKVYTISLLLDTVNQSVMLTGSRCLSPRISCFAGCMEPKLIPAHMNRHLWITHTGELIMGARAAPLPL